MTPVLTLYGKPTRNHDHWIIVITTERTILTKVMMTTTRMMTTRMMMMMMMMMFFCYYYHYYFSFIIRVIAIMTGHCGLPPKGVLQHLQGILPGGCTTGRQQRSEDPRRRLQHLLNRPQVLGKMLEKPWRNHGKLMYPMSGQTKTVTPMDLWEHWHLWSFCRERSPKQTDLHTLTHTSWAEISFQSKFIHSKHQLTSLIHIYVVKKMH